MDHLKTFFSPITNSKPIVFQLTDKWVPYFLFIILLLVFFANFFVYNPDSSLSAFFMTVFGYIGIRWMLGAFFKAQPNFTFGARLIIIGFYWLFGLLGGFGFLCSSIFLTFSKQSFDIDTLVMSCAGFVVAIGASFSITPNTDEKNY